MHTPIYLGDEVTAAGYRLAGVQVHVPAPGEAGAAFAEARAQAPLVLLSAAVAARIDAAQLRGALMALQPLVLIVPDARGEIPRPDLAARLRGQLGMEA
jgi:vacuolar-type H+-ATPase subunit F/Vma7